MVATPELEKPEAMSQQKLEETAVKEIPEIPELSEAVEKLGVTTPPTQVTAQATDDQGQAGVLTPATQVITIQIPATPTQLLDWSKGESSASLTWLGAFWLRLIKKALHFGWRIVMGNQGGVNA